MEFSADSREYFTRHMRVLERCMHAWPMPEVQKQIDSIREAFSADTRKPFVLKASFPYGSPHAANRLSPARSHPGNYTHRPSVRGSIDHPQQQTIDTQGAVQHSQVSYSGHPMTPPISAGPVDLKSDSPAAQSLAMMSASSAAGHSSSSQAPTLMPMTSDGGSGWNPSRIFESVEHNLTTSRRCP